MSRGIVVILGLQKSYKEFDLQDHYTSFYTRLMGFDDDQRLPITSPYSMRSVKVSRACSIHFILITPSLNGLLFLPKLMSDLSKFVLKVMFITLYPYTVIYQVSSHQ